MNEQSRSKYVVIFVITYGQTFFFSSSFCRKTNLTRHHRRTHLMALKTERPFIWRTPIDNSNIAMSEPFYHPYLSHPYEYSRLQTRDLSTSPALSQSSILSSLSSSGSIYSTTGSSPSSPTIPTIYSPQPILPTPQVGSAIGYGSFSAYYDNNGYTSPPALSSATSSPSPPETPILQSAPLHCVSECYCCWQNHQFLQWQVQQVIKQQNHPPSKFQYNQHEVDTNLLNF